MNTFEIRTDNILQNPPSALAEYDCAFIIYLKDKKINFELHADEGFEEEMAFMLWAIKKDAITEEILKDLPDVLENGDIIAEILEEKLADEHGHLSTLEDCPIIQPAMLFQDNDKNNEE